MKILGIDPGTATTGYGIIKVKKGENKPACVDYGSILTSPALNPCERLKRIEKEINKLINRFHPQVLAVEKLYFSLYSCQGFFVSESLVLRKA